MAIQEKAKLIENGKAIKKYIEENVQPYLNNSDVIVKFGYILDGEKNRGIQIYSDSIRGWTGYGSYIWEVEQNGDHYIFDGSPSSTSYLRELCIEWQKIKAEITAKVDKIIAERKIIENFEV